MIRELLRCAKADGNPLNHMIETMSKDGPKDNGWKKLHVTAMDISEMEKFLAIMSPFEFLASKMNSEYESSIQRLYPTLHELLILLGEIEKNEEDIAYEYAKV